MPVRFENFAYSFDRKGKPVFAPSIQGRRVGNDLKRKIEKAVSFPAYYYHLQPGGHVAALHAHRPNRFFSKMDIERFFYTIGRNRVAKNLRKIGIDRADHYARWSTVKNPFDNPSYAVPYGFVQSPIVATLVLDCSPLGALLQSLSQTLSVSVYVDDISLSANDEEVLKSAFEKVGAALDESGFRCNAGKSREPSPKVEVFNCELVQGSSTVTRERVAEFQGKINSEASQRAFERYCLQVETGNA
jgi:Reverse transcriptase (RNA-dependent DNA polymerase)